MLPIPSTNVGYICVYHIINPFCKTCKCLKKFCTKPVVVIEDKLGRPLTDTLTLNTGSSVVISTPRVNLFGLTV